MNKVGLRPGVGAVLWWGRRSCFTEKPEPWPWHSWTITESEHEVSEETCRKKKGTLGAAARGSGETGSVCGGRWKAERSRR